MTFFKDQLGREVFIPEIPKRIVSLVPSQTELLYDLNLDEEVVGITRFCIHPEEWFDSKTRVGGTKDFKVEQIRKLKPDLIIANKEENDLNRLLPLMDEFPVWVSDVSNIEQALAMISSIGIITGRSVKANQLIDTISSEYLRLEEYVKQSPIGKRKCIYYIWYRPWMSVGEDTFIYDQLLHCGIQPVTKGKYRYPEIPIEVANESKADLLFLSSEPFPFTEKHATELKVVIPESKIVFVDGEFFSWYGSRLANAPSYFIRLMETLKTSG